MLNKYFKVMCVASLCLSLATGCSVYNGFLKGTQTVIHDKLGISTGDKDHDYMIDTYSKLLEGVPFSKINAALDYKLQESSREDESFIKSIGVLSVYTYQDSDCNMAIYFDEDDNFNMFSVITPELCKNAPVRVNGKLVQNDTKARFLRSLAESSERLPYGHCTFVRNRFDKFKEIDGKNLTVLEIQKAMEEEKAKELEKNKAEARAKLAAEDGNTSITNADIANSDLKSVATQLSAIQQAQQEVMKKNSRNGKMRVCTVDTKEPGLVVGATEDGKIKFEKESDGTVVEVDTDNLELCADSN